MMGSPGKLWQPCHSFQTIPWPCVPPESYCCMLLFIFISLVRGGDVMRGRRLLPLKLYVLTLHCQTASCSNLHNLDLKPTWHDYISQGFMLIHQAEHAKLCGLRTWLMLWNGWLEKERKCQFYYSFTTVYLLNFYYSSSALSGFMCRLYSLSEHDNSIIFYFQKQNVCWVSIHKWKVYGK